MENTSRRVPILAALAVSIASATVGCFASWPAPMLPKFKENETSFHINDNEIAWTVAMSSPGFMVGSLCQRHVADRFGRRATILYSVIPAVIGTIIGARAKAPWMLYLMRFLWGSGNGMIATVAGVYFAEIADKDIRGTLSLVTRFMFNFGNLLMMTIGPFVSYTTLNYMLLAMPISYFIACWCIPESPYFYLKEGKVEAARKVLKMIRGYKDEKMLEDELLRMQSQVKNEMRRSSTFVELVTGKQYRKAVFCVLGIKSTQILSGQLIIQQYLGIIMKESRSTLKLSTVFIVFGAVRFVVGVMSSILADKVGRRPLLIYSYFGTGISMGIVAVYFLLLELNLIDEESLSPYGFVAFAGIILANIISTLGYNSLISLVPAEIFPLNVKAVAMTSLSIFGGLTNFITCRSYQVIKDLSGLYGVFCIFSVACIGGGVFSMFGVPETKGKSLKEIQIQLQGDLYENDEACKKLNDMSVVVDSDIQESKELKEIVRRDSNKL